jgi:hypothetical protein
VECRCGLGLAGPVEEGISTALVELRCDGLRSEGGYGGDMCVQGNAGHFEEGGN